MCNAQLRHRRNGAFGSPEYLDGDIAVLSMYNRQLTAEEVESLAQFYSCRFNFVTESKQSCVSAVSPALGSGVRCCALIRLTTRPWRTCNRGTVPWKPCLPYYHLSEAWVAAVADSCR